IDNPFSLIYSQVAKGDLLKKFSVTGTLLSSHNVGRFARTRKILQMNLSDRLIVVFRTAKALLSVEQFNFVKNTIEVKISKRIAGTKSNPPVEACLDKHDNIYAFTADVGALFIFDCNFQHLRTLQLYRLKPKSYIGLQEDLANLGNSIQVDSNG